jgi:transposase
MHKASGLSWSVLSLVILDNAMFFIGIDVSKAKLDCSLLLDAANSKRRAKSVANSKIGISELLSWCANNR